MLIKRMIVGLLAPMMFVVSGFCFDGTEPLSRSQLRQMLVDLGYTVTDLDKTAGKEKVSVVVQRGGLNVPVGAEVSPNGNYIWLTVNLGAGKPDNAAYNYGLLKKNSEIQPFQFYVTASGRLMLAVPLENRGLTNVRLRERLDGIVENVVNTQTLWSVPGN